MHPDSIRLLEPEPSESYEADLHATVITARLGDKPAYEAISYTWGEDIFPEMLHLTVAGHTLRWEVRSKIQISENLASALRRFRRKDSKRTLWADAVCINQSDNLEKAWQVSLMKRIFKNAEQVLIWLGKETDETGPALEYVRQVATLA